MVNNFTHGGQVFLHKIRMLSQVIYGSIKIAIILSLLISTIIYLPSFRKLDIRAVCSYYKASIVSYLDHNIYDVLRQNKSNVTYINVASDNGFFKNNVKPSFTLSHSIFKNARNDFTELLKHFSITIILLMFVTFSIVFFIWSKFGAALQVVKSLKGSATILSGKEVSAILKTKKLLSKITIGNVPMVKDMETRHFLVTGATGSGKTNLIHNLIPQLHKLNHPGIIIDQTGEMISKYYNKERGDIIFNPFDKRSHSWDFWKDCASEEEIYRFAKIIMGFNRKSSGAFSDPFWENAATDILNCCLNYLSTKDATTQEIADVVCNKDLDYLRKILKGSRADRYLIGDAERMATSVLATLSANSSALHFLKDESDQDKFSLKKYFQGIKNGKNNWLFLSTKPSSRELTLPLISCITELALSNIIDVGIKANHKTWIIIDELASLGRLPALGTLMSEGRKYGACVVACLQSLNQLYDIYGTYKGSSIFGQFGTSFFFRNQEHAICKMISELSGTEVTTKSNKSTSFGANQLRDGISYNEYERKKPLLEANNISGLSTGECYVLLPESSTRIAKTILPLANNKDMQEGFIDAKRNFCSFYQQQSSQESKDTWAEPAPPTNDDDSTKTKGQKNKPRKVKTPEFVI